MGNNNLDEGEQQPEPRGTIAQTMENNNLDEGEQQRK
jgi:hypothetical protein